ncbi:MAG TPA: hypothetical protein VF960_10490 [Chloroflexota bacterium]
MPENISVDWPGGTGASCEYPIDPGLKETFQRALRAMNRARVPYVVGGAFALHWYSGYHREAKDLDFFLMPEDSGWAMRVLEGVGFNVWRKHPEWMSQAHYGNAQVDLIYGMGNWLGYVDRVYLQKAKRGLILDVPAWIMAPEEMIYCKAFVASRDRYDAADLQHLLVATGGFLDWDRLLGRFADHWEVLLSHLIMFQYIYPSHRDAIPDEVLDRLIGRLAEMRRQPWTDGKVCRGFFVDGNGGYKLDVEEWGYRDVRQEQWDALQRRLDEEASAA